MVNALIEGIKEALGQQRRAVSSIPEDREQTVWVTSMRKWLPAKSLRKKIKLDTDLREGKGGKSHS